MRRILAGIGLILLAPWVALGQVRGEVESVGFQNIYRPDCWTPMTVKLIPETGKTDFYQIQVIQEDLDRDRAVFTRTVSVTGGGEGQAREQRFRMYFIPQPTGGGLPDARDPTMQLKDLNESLVVNVTTANGKLIARLPITATITNIDPRPGMWEARRGVRLMLAVTDGRSTIAYGDRGTSIGNTVGMVEDVVFISVRPDDLPENVLGYDAVDGIVWLSADPASLRGGTDEKRRALEQYVRRGGRLVICQHPEWQKTLEFGEMLPVNILGVQDRADPKPLRSLRQPRRSTVPLPERPLDAQRVDPWERLSGPFRLARAEAQPGAVVDEWILWDEAGDDRSPYIVRKRYGLGSVTWVAQDLGDPNITSRTRTGWIHIWDRIFDFRDEPIVLIGNESPRDVPQFAPGASMDMGAALLKGMDMPSRTAWLITLAIVFFIAYWLVAGPGGFAFLHSRRKAHLSWFLFGATALGATALTVLLVKAVLRGPPQLQHFSVVRMAPGEDAVVFSRFGLYIPRDGYENVELKQTAAGAVSAISAFPQHPIFTEGQGDLRGPEYVVPIVDVTSDEPPAVRFPYSSTLKKLQATWVGPISGRVDGAAALVEQGWIEGRITNGTGQRLRNVYIAFKYPAPGGGFEDWILYLPVWEPDVTLDLRREFNRGDDGAATPFLRPEANPDRGVKVRGRIDVEWTPYWYPRLRGGMMADWKFDDTRDSVRRSLPMLSLFERLPPAKNEANVNRFELLRRGGRFMDVSQALAAGSLVVLAQAEGPIPIPLEVEGSAVTGTGTILYQFILPLDRSAVEVEPIEDDGAQPAAAEGATNADFEPPQE